MQSLIDREIAAIAKRLSMNPKAAARLSGSIKIDLPAAVENEPSKSLELGLRFNQFEAGLLAQRAKLTACIEDALRGYQSACPAVFEWVGRGDFDPLSVPAELKPAVLTHATRSAGRLRAKALRTLSTGSM